MLKTTKKVFLKVEIILDDDDIEKSAHYEDILSTMVNFIDSNISTKDKLNFNLNNKYISENI